MKLFEEFEAVSFSEENLIFITHNEYLYYIYDTEWKIWKKHRNAGNKCCGSHTDFVDDDREAKDLWSLYEFLKGYARKEETDML